MLIFRLLFFQVGVVKSISTGLGCSPDMLSVLTSACFEVEIGSLRLDSSDEKFNLSDFRAGFFFVLVLLASNS